MSHTCLPSNSTFSGYETVIDALGGMTHERFTELHDLDIDISWKLRGGWLEIVLEVPQHLGFLRGVDGHVDVNLNHERIVPSIVVSSIVGCSIIDRLAAPREPQASLDTTL